MRENTTTKVSPAHLRHPRTQAKHTSNDEALISLRDITIGYEGTNVVHNVSLNLAPGMIGCLLGPSGCGKSTILRAIAGFEPLSEGEIWLNGQLISSAKAHVNPEQRRIGMVFQDFALFPHLTVAQNIAFGLKDQSKQAKKSRVDELLALITMTDFADRYPHALSGGQQQRVALARAIAPRPNMLLMDEPFSSLDVEMREQLVPDVRRILQHEQITGILVTHDQLEAFGMADQIAVMARGRVEQFDTGYNLYHRPETKFVADFIGQGEFIQAEVLDTHRINSIVGEFTGSKPHGFAVGQTVEVLIRPDDVLHDDESPTLAKIVSKQFRGSHFLYRVQFDSQQTLFCFAPSHHNHMIDEDIGVKVDIDHLVMFAAEQSSSDQANQSVTLDSDDVHSTTQTR